MVGISSGAVRNEDYEKMNLSEMTTTEFMGMLKDLQANHLEPKFREIVKHELEIERTAFWIPAERHYNEHTHLARCVVSAEEREANHEFVSRFRKRGSRAGEIAFYLSVSAVCVWTAATFWGGFIAAMHKMFKQGG